MRVKKEPVILAVVIVALAAYLGLRQMNGTHYDLPAVPAVPAKDISKIEIAAGESTLVLTRQDDDWVIGPEAYPADDDKVAAMTRALGELDVTALVAESSSYARYELDEAGRISVSAWAGENRRRRLDIGKAASTFQHTFVKFPEDAAVYHAAGNLRRTFEVSLDELRDKTALAFAPDAIGEVFFSAGGRSLRAAKAAPEPQQTAAAEGQETTAAAPPETVWTAEDGRELDASRVSRLLKTLSTLTCSGYVEGRSAEAFTDPVLEIRLTGAEAITLTIYAPEDGENGDHPAVSSQNGYPFRLPKWKVDDIRQYPDELLGTPEEVAADPAGGEP